MAKNKDISADEFEEIFEFSDMDDGSFGETNMSDIMHLLMDSNNHQMNVAVELTKLIIGNKTPNEDDVFSLFKKSAKVVSESYNLDNLMDQLGQK